MFTLPPVEAGLVGVSYVDGLPIGPDTQLVPHLRVLPMGWSWALHLCQQVLMHAIDVAGFEQRHIIGDKRSAVQLRALQDTAVAGYVDNFGVFGCDKQTVDQGLGRIIKVLRGWGLTVHEIEEAQLSADFVGLHFNGAEGYVSIKPTRVCKIRSGIDELLRSQFCSGRVLQLVLGHCTWALMARREGLAILSSSYAFVHQNGDKFCRLWPSVRRELSWLRSILPLLRMKVNCGWAHEATASDASPWGYGICHRQLEREVVQGIGSFSEKWRFKFEDAKKARLHALLGDVRVGGANVSAQLERVPESSSATAGSGGCASTFIQDLGFAEIPEKVLQDKEWSVVWSRPWRYESNILNTEAKALVWSVEHMLRSNRCIGKRLLCFSDNLPLVLSAVKGRGKSHHLLQPLRKLAALSLATGSKVHTRWIPSESNVADAPSRAIQQWKAQRFARWWSDADFEAGETAEHKFKPKIQNFGPAPFSEVKDATPPRPELPGEPKCAPQHPPGLHEPLRSSGKLAWDELASAGQSTYRGRPDGRVPRGPFRRRGWNRQWDSSRCGAEVLPSTPGKGGSGRAPSCSSMLEGVGACSPASTEVAHPPGGFRSSDRDPHPSMPMGDGTATIHPVHLLSSPRGVLGPVEEAAGPATNCGGDNGRFATVGHLAPPFRGHGARKERNLRRVGGHRLRRLDESFVAPAPRHQGGQRSAVEPFPHRTDRCLQWGSGHTEWGGTCTTSDTGVPPTTS